MVAITGASGVGKSTFLHVLGALDRPEEGEVRVAGESVFGLPEPELRRFRNETIGFVFQFHHLLPEFTALENVMMPMLIARRPEREARAAARALAAEVGLGERLEHRPSALSGGEQQRVAVARALAADPALLLADEPTGNLDADRTLEVMELLANANARGTTVLIATHDRLLLERYKRRVVQLERGRLLSDGAAFRRAALT